MELSTSLEIAEMYREAIMTRRLGVAPLSRCNKRIEVGQKYDCVLIAAGGMHHDPGAGCAALIARCMGYIGGNVDLVSSAHPHPMLQCIAVIDRTIALPVGYAQPISHPPDR